MAAAAVSLKSWVLGLALGLCPPLWDSRVVYGIGHTASAPEGSKIYGVTLSWEQWGFRVMNFQKLSFLRSPCQSEVKWKWRDLCFLHWALAKEGRGWGSVSNLVSFFWGKILHQSKASIDVLYVLKGYCFFWAGSNQKGFHLDRRDVGDNFHCFNAPGCSLTKVKKSLFWFPLVPF